jgi:hypothetical protein
MASWGKRFARGVRRAPGVMNSLESRYADHLHKEQLAGAILWYDFDAIKLRLAEKTFYTPDFFILNRDSELEVHEVKGHWEDDARVKIKVAAQKFPFKFVAITLERGQWIKEEF